MATKKSYSSKPKKEVISVDEVDYEIVQMTGLQMEEFREQMTGRYDVNPNDPERSVLVRQKGLMADLIVRCLYPIKVFPEKTRLPVERDLVDSWSYECTEAVYDDCQRVNGVTKAAAKDEVKNG
jgi:hypothetical protein